MEKRIPRIIEHNQTSELVAMIALISAIRPREADAILVVTGEGEHDRVFHGVELWKQNFGKYLLITGNSRKTRKRFGAYTKEYIAQLCQVDQEDPRIVVGQTNVRNTLDQINWAATVIAKVPIKSLIVVSSVYHLPRVLLTLLGAIQKRQLKLVLVPNVAPLLLPRDYLRIPGEIKRITQYQKKGDIATFKELYEHFFWQLSQQPQPFQEFQGTLPRTFFSFLPKIAEIDKNRVSLTILKIECKLKQGSF